MHKSGEINKPYGVDENENSSSSTFQVGSKVGTSLSIKVDGKPTRLPRCSWGAPISEPKPQVKQSKTRANAKVINL